MKPLNGSEPNVKYKRFLKRCFFPVALGLLLAMTAIVDAEVYTVWGDAGDIPTERPLPALNGELESGGNTTYAHPDDREPRSDLGRTGAINGRYFAGLAFEITLSEDTTFTGKIQVKSADVGNIFQKNSANFSVAGGGTHRVFVDWKDFDRAEALDAWVKFIKTISVSGTLSDGTEKHVRISNARLVRGDVLAVSCRTNGKAAEAGEDAVYELRLRNVRDKPLSVTASAIKRGWEEMNVRIKPPRVTLPPGESKRIRVRVTPTDRVPKGNYEVQKIRFVPNGDAAAAETMKLYTSRLLDTPNVIFDREGWDAVRQKSEQYDWAGKKRADRVKSARNWSVPKTEPERGNNSYVYNGKVANHAKNAAIAWQLSRDRKLAEKVALYLRRFSDPETGYPAVRRACNAALVQEGNFFRKTATAFDLIKDSEVLTPQDVDNLKTTFRLYEQVIMNEGRRGVIGNHQVSMAAGGLYAALSINDMAMANRFIHDPGMLMDMFAAGFMPDGWWHESALNYSTSMTNRYLQIARALKHRGIDWLNKGFPVKYSQKLRIDPSASGDPTEAGGMDFLKYGPVSRSTLTLEDLYDGILPFMDYRGVSFGMNDARSRQIGGMRFELAYHVFRSPKFLPALNRLKPNERSLLYGVPDLPEPPEEMARPYEKSFHADNIGYAVLRSQNDRPVEERIQAALKYGTDGGHHGHDDRTNLVCLMRYGREMGTPHGEWFSYGNVFYRIFNQMSTQHNMVVVDQKTQEPTESELLHFYSGDNLQAAAVETDTRWSFIPPVNQKGDRRMQDDRRFIPTYPDAPDNPMKLQGFTEKIRQRRLLLVTDDYIVMADALKGEKKHTYDNSLWIRGMEEMTAPEKTFLRRDPQLDPDPRKAAQLITNVDWYDAEGTVQVDYSYEIEPGSRLAERANNEPGPMNFSVFHAWPREDRIVGECDLPNSSHHLNIKWHIADKKGKELSAGQTQPWSIGTGEAELDVQGKDRIRLAVKAVHHDDAPPSLFWHGKIVTKDGEEIPLADIPYEVENLRHSEPKSEDYRGGPIDIAGVAVDRALPAEPADRGKAGVIKLDLSGLEAVSLKAVIGADHPVGVKQKRRRGLIARQTGKTARFLTVIEPFENKSVVESVEATSPGSLTVTLTDGRVHTFKISGMDGSEGDISVEMTETQDGETLSEEDTL